MVFTEMDFFFFLIKSWVCFCNFLIAATLAQYFSERTCKSAPFKTGGLGRAPAQQEAAPQSSGGCSSPVSYSPASSRPGDPLVTALPFPVGTGSCEALGAG